MAKAKLQSEDDSLPGCERLGKLLFLQLDPTLRNLLTVLQHHQDLTEASCHVSHETVSGESCVGASLTTGAVNGIVSSQHQKISPQNITDHYLEQEERVLGLLKTEARLLQHAQEIVSDFATNLLRQRDASSSLLALLNQQLAGSMNIMMDYISLPILAILQRPFSSSGSNVSEHQGEEMTTALTSVRKFRIRQAAERKSVAMATRSLKTCLDIFLLPLEGAATEESHKQHRQSLLSPDKTLSLILACSSALPTGREITEQSTMSFSDGINHDGGIVDHGEEYLESTLEVLYRLLAMGKLSSSTFDVDLFDAVGGNGALVAHLADVCMSIVSPPSTLPESTLLKALETLLCLLETVPNTSIWQALFPGCFAGLFRTQVAGLRKTGTAQSKVQVLVASLQVLVMLLRLTLNDAKPRTKERKTQCSLADLKQNRSVLAESTASNQNQQSTTVPDSSTSSMGVFSSEINKRLPGPLAVLSKLLLTANSESIRKEAANFYRIIVVDTRPSWEKQVLGDLSITALDCCLILTRDTDHAVRASARSILDAYKALPAFRQDMASFLVPRIVSMMEDLPALAQRQSETELRNQLKLITAFLSLSNESDEITASAKRHSGSKALRSSLAAENVAINLRRAFALIFDVDFGSFHPLQWSLTGSTDHSNLMLDATPRSGRPYLLRFLTSASESEATDMVREFGRALGPKHAAVFIDACVANLFQDCVTRVEGGVPRVGKSQEIWCHEWVGCLTLVRELLVGAFSARYTAAAATDAPTPLLRRKEAKYLTQLATSILPIIVSPPLSDSPVHPADIESTDTFGAGSFALTSSFEDVASIFALRGNASLLFGSFQIVRTIVRLLRDDAAILIPMILTPLVEKASSSRVPHVRDEAQSALSEIALALGYKSLANMLNHYLGIVAGSVLASLRLPGGNFSFQYQSDGNRLGIIARTIRWIIECLLVEENEKHISADDGEELVHRDKSNFTYILELVTTLTERYDCAASKSTHEFETTIAIVGVYEASFRLLLEFYRADEAAARRRSRKTLKEKSQPWLEHLNIFRRLAADDMKIHDLDGKSFTESPKEGFDAYRKGREGSEENEGLEDSKSKQSTDCLVSHQETYFVSVLISRCTFFLSNSNLRLQLESCSAMAEGFRFLATVALLCKDPEHSSSTALTGQVNDAWNPIRARLVALTTEIVSSRSTSVTIIRQSQATAPMKSPMADPSTRRVFLSKAFELVTIMAECSGDFIASRFKNDVFPLVAKLLGSFAEDALDSRDPFPLYCNHLDGSDRHSGISAQNISINSSAFPRQASEAELITSVLCCFAGVFQETACGRSIAGLIPTLGTLILPFLGDQDTGTWKACMAALRQMIQIDSDALWRPLVHLSGRPFPPRKPWELPAQSTPWEEAADDASPISTRAIELVEFINIQPEQPL